MIVTIKSWRDMKRSPYFFLRQQAARRLQAYSLTSLTLILVTLLTAAYTWQQPLHDGTVRVATLANNKPAKSEVRALVDAAPSRLAEATAAETAVSQQPISTTDDLATGVDGTQLLERTLTLPTEYDQYEPAAELTDETEIGRIVFSTKIDDQYTAVNPTTIFAEGNYTLYATFSYDGMRDGMVWSWVWRRDGEVVDGGNAVWTYGPDGPGYVYYSPEEGFENGEYTLEIWVNRELFTRSDMLINTAAAAANN